MTTLNIIDISHVENYCPQDRLVPDELQNCHAHYRWDREVWQVAYYKGYREPRFSVPALPMAVNIGTIYVVVYNTHTNKGIKILHWFV